MIYSCFDAASGLYDYYETSQKTPLNADLPIPQLGASDYGIGVPSIKAGRPLPPDAKHIGRGWHARGMIVSRSGGAMGSISDLATSSTTWIVLFAVGAAVLFTFDTKERR